MPGLSPPSTAPAIPAQGVGKRLLNVLPLRFWAALVLFAFGLVVGLVVWRLNHVLLRRTGIDDAIEGTAIERTSREFGTTTVNAVATLSAAFVVFVVLLVALGLAGVEFVTVFSAQVTSFLLRGFVATLVVLVGVVAGDKAELYVGERLREVKIPESGIVPTATKYTVLYVAALLALAQVGVDVFVLVLLFAVYALALVVFGALATKDLLACAAAGVFLLLTEPYGIGDEVRIGDTRGIVQEVGIFVTHVENDDAVFVVPNRKAVVKGVVRVRN